MRMYRMIVVDDEEELREGISNYFPWEKLNIQIVGIFENGKVAYSYIKTHSVDIVLTDIRMPFMDGLELIEKAKSIAPSISYVILSGYREFEYAKRGLSLGVKDYILKPTKYSQIYEVFSRLTTELNDNEPLKDVDFVLSNADHVIISTIKRYIRTHYAEVTLDRVADYVHLNPYYLSTLFKQQTGEKFSDYVCRIKMETASTLLERGTESIKDIGEAVGYTNPNSFTRAFRQYYDCSPKEYRRKKQGFKD